MSAVATFERRLGNWLADDSEVNLACSCCRRRRSATGRQLLVGWAALPHDVKVEFLDAHGSDRYVGALEQALELARDAARADHIASWA